MVVMSVINITIGSKWRVALRRAKLAGQLLARMLMQVRGPAAVGRRHASARLAAATRTRGFAGSSAAARSCARLHALVLPPPLPPPPIASVAARLLLEHLPTWQASALAGAPPCPPPSHIRLPGRPLPQGLHGERPVTLVGFSMGARLVFHCCLELERHGAAGLLEHVVLLGSPVSVRHERWAAVRSVVAGRVVNGYSSNDWTLGIVYRAHSSSGLVQSAAGLVPVGLPGVESVDLSHLVKGHEEYIEHMEEVLRLVGFARDV
jgi:hypothetical protein